MNSGWPFDARNAASAEPFVQAPYQPDPYTWFPFGAPHAATSGRPTPLAAPYQFNPGASGQPPLLTQSALPPPTAPYGQEDNLLADFFSSVELYQTSNGCNGESSAQNDVRREVHPPWLKPNQPLPAIQPALIQSQDRREPTSISPVAKVAGKVSPHFHAKSFSSIQPTTPNNASYSSIQALSQEDALLRRQILEILYADSRPDLEAAGHMGFGKTRIDLALLRPCQCAQIEAPVLWVLAPDKSLDGECSFPERTWLRMDSGVKPSEIRESPGNQRLYNIVYDFSKARRNAHALFHNVKVKVKVKAKVLAKETDTVAEVYSLHAPIAAAFVYVFTWEHLGHCAGMTASQFFSVGTTNAKTHVLTAAHHSRKRRRTNSASQSSPSTLEPSTDSAMLDTAEGSPNPCVPIPEHVEEALRNLSRFLSGQKTNNGTPQQTALTIDYDAYNRLRLHSVSPMLGPIVLVLSGTRSELWLDFLYDFALFLPRLMQIEDFEELQANHVISVTNQIYLLHQVVSETPRSAEPTREHGLIKIWGRVLTVIRSHCDPRHEARFDALLMMNQKLLCRIVDADDDSIVANLPVDPNDIQYLAGLLYADCLVSCKFIIGLAARQAKSWRDKWIESRQAPL